MGLKEQIEKDEKELKKLQAEEDGGEDETDDTEDEDTEEDGEGADDSEDGDDSEEEGDDEGKKQPEPKDDKGKKAAEDDANGKKPDAKDDKGNPDARLRAERKKRLKLEEELAELKNRQPAQQQPQPKPAAQEQPKAKAETTEEKVARLEREQTNQRQERERNELHQAAVEEFNDIEKAFASETPDYEEASAHMIAAMFNGVKHANPGVGDKQALAHVQRTVLSIASQAVKRNQNPAEVLYQMAFDNYGFQPGAKKAQKNSNATEKLQKIAQNKKRSASPFAGGGQNSAARATIDEGVKMDLASFSKLSDAEIDEMISQADS